MQTATLRDELHELVDRLSETNLAPARDRLRELVDAQPRPSLDEILAKAPIDDEPLTDDEIAGLEEARQEVAAGHSIPDDVFWRELGIEPDEE
jgi:hypothetical protein